MKTNGMSDQSFIIAPMPTEQVQALKDGAKNWEDDPRLINSIQPPETNDDSAGGANRKD